MYNCKRYFLVILFFLLGYSAKAQLCTFVSSNQGSSKASTDRCTPNTSRFQVRFEFVPAASAQPGWDPNLVDFLLLWGDGSPLKSLGLPDVGTDPELISFTYSVDGFTGNHVFEMVAEHIYPPGAVCSYTASATLRYSPNVCVGNRQEQIFEAWATDDLNGGNLGIDPMLFQVCLGDDFSLDFRDVTTFNCNDDLIPAVAFPNEEMRWVRFEYGDPGNGARIPNVFVGGVNVTNNAGTLQGAGPGGVHYDNQGPLADGVIEYPNPAENPSAVSEIVSMVSTGDEMVGDRFLITLQNWNECNKYTDGDPPIEIQAIIEIIDSPPPPNAPDRDYCENSIGTLTANGTGGGTLTWYDDAGLTNVVHTGGVYVHGQSAVGTYTYYVTETLGNNCEGPPQQVDMEIWQRPNGANAGPNQYVCDVTNATLNGNNPNVGTGTWTVLTGPATVDFPNDPNSTVSGLGPGTNQFRWTFINGPCQRFDVTNIYRDITPAAANAGADQDLCDVFNFGLNANAATNNGMGTWKVVTNAIYFETFNNLADGTTSDGAPTGWSIVDGSPGNTNNFSVQDNRFDATGTRGEARIITSVIDISSFASVDISVDVANIQNGQFEGADYVRVFYILDGGGETMFATNGNNTNDFANTVASQTGLSGSTLQIVIRIQNSADNESHYIDNIFVYETPSGALPTFSDVNDENATVSNLLPGPNELMWEVTSQNGVCPVSVDTVIITVDRSVVAVEGPDQTLCSTTSTFLAADAPINNGTGTWSLIAGTGAITDPNDPATEVTGLTLGVTSTFRWMVVPEFGICPTVSNDVDVFVDPSPGATANAGADQAICGNETATMAGSIGGSASTLTWTTGGDGSFDDPTLGNAVYTPGANDRTNGTVTLTITTDDPVGICPAAADNMILTVDPIPAANDVVTGLCETVTATGIFIGFNLTTLEGSVNGGGGITYAYFEDMVGTPVPDETNVDITNGDDFFVIVSDGTCQDTAQLDFTVQALPTANDRNPIDLCEDTAGSGSVAGVDLTAEEAAINGGAGITYSYFEDINLTTPVADATNVTVDNGANADFYVLVDDGTCADTALIFFNVIPLPTANDVPLTLCEESAGVGLINNYNLTSNEAAINGGGGITYSYFENAALTIPVGSPNSLTINNGDDFFVLVDDGTCTDTAAITIAIQTLPTATDVVIDLCEAVPGAPLEVTGVDLTTNEAAINGGGGITYTYFEDANLATVVATPNNVDVTDGDDFFVLVDDGTCPDTARIDYNIFDQAEVNAAAVTTVIVPGGTIDLSPSTSGGSTATISWSTSGDGTFLPDPVTLGAIYDPGPGDEAALPSTITLTLTSDDPAGPCPADVSTVDITIADPATADAGPDQEICADATATMAGSIGGTATSLTWTSSGDGSFDDPTSANAIYTPGAADIAGAPQALTLTITTDDPDGGGPIMPATDDMILQINPLPVTAIPVGGISGCVGDVINYVIPGAAATSSFAWDISDLPGAVINAGGDPLPFITIQYTSALAGRDLTVTETEMVTATMCVGLPVTLGGITILSPPVVDAGSNETTCEGVPFDLSTSGTPPSESDALSFIWTHNGAGFFTNPNILQPVYNPVPADAGTVVTLTLTAGGAGTCPTAMDNMLLTVNPVSTVNVGVDLSTCENTAANLNGVVGGTFTDLLWTSSTGLGTFSDPTIANPTYTADPADFGSVITLRLTASDASASSCPDVFDELDISIIEIPVVNAGGAQQVCEGDVVNLTGTVSVAGYTTTWSGGTGSFGNAANVNTTYTPGGLDMGPVVLTLTASDPSGACADVASNVTITFEAPPIADAGSNQETCENTPFDLSTSATVPTASNFSSLMWTTSGTGTFDDPTLLTPEYTPGAGETGAVTLTLEALGNATCTSVSDNMTLSVTPEPVANAGSDEERCAGVAFQLNMSVTPPSVMQSSSVMWTSSGTGLFNDATQLQPTYTPSVGDAGTVVTLTLEAFGNGSCTSVTDDMQLTVTLAPIANAGSDEEICEGATFDLSTAAVPATEANASSRIWTHNGTGSFNDPTLLLPTYTPGAGETGNITLTLEVSGNGSCAPVTDNMQLTITAEPTVDAGIDGEVCQGGAYALALSSPSTTNSSALLWTTSGSGLFNNATQPTPVYTPGAGDEGTVVTLTLEAFGNGSCNSVTDAMQLTVTLAPVANAGSNEEICAGDIHDFNTSAAPPSESNASSRLWTHDGTGTLDNPTVLAPTYTPGAGETGLVTFTLEVFGNGSCTSVTDNMFLTITPNPTVDAGSDEETCEGFAHDFGSNTVRPSITNAASVTWTHNGTGSLDDPNILLPVYTPGPGETGAVILTLEVIGNGSCAAVNTTDFMTLTITPAPVADAGADGEICRGLPYNFAASVPSEMNGNGIMWTHTGTGSFDDPTIINPTYTPGVGETGVVTVTLRVFGNGSCTSVTDIMLLTITPSPNVFAGSNQETCEAIPFDLSGSGVLPQASNFSSLMWTTSGTGTFDDPTLLTPIYTPGAGETGAVTLTLEALGNGSCVSATDDMVVTVTPAPAVDAGDDAETCEGAPVDLDDPLVRAVMATGSNFSFVQWTSSGSGNFNNNTLLNPIYIPSAGDAGTVVTLTLEAFGNGSCVSVKDSIELTVTLAPTADAGSDEQTCEGIAFDLAGSATPPSESNSSGRMWTTSGTGTFDDPTELMPEYTPGAGETGLVILTLEVFGNGSCTSVTNNMILNVTPGPVVDAGSDEEICEGMIFDLFGDPAVRPTAGNFSGVLWTTSGDGSFSNDAVLNPLYIPGAADPGTVVTLTLEVFGNGTCTSVTDAMQLTVTSAPTVDAGTDEETCQGIPFDLSTSASVPSATNFSSVMWTHNGAGSFNDPTNLTPVYTPGVGETGTIDLTLEVFGNGSCPSVTDVMRLSITREPTVNAGSDEETCENISFTLSSSAMAPSATNFSSLLWTHNGAGTLTNDDQLIATYTPDVGETGVVTLSLEVFGNGSCVSVTDDMLLTITPGPVVDAGSDEETCQADPFDFATSATVPLVNNFSTLQWTHNGAGSLDDPTIITPIYTPAGGETGLVTFTLEVFGNGSCSSTTDNMRLTITPLPTSFAGSDEETCELVPINLAGITSPPNASSFSSVMWTSTGAGTFDNATSLTPIYTPAAGETGMTTLTLEVFGNGSCVSATDDLLLTITPAPIPDAGSDAETCQGVPYDLTMSVPNPSVANELSFSWSHNGTGSFDNPGLLTPMYTPGVGESGTVTLTLNATGNGSCITVSDAMTLTITPFPVVDAGSNEETCEGVAFDLSTSATPPNVTNFSSLMWTTSGAGSFDDPTLLTPIYTPGGADAGTIITLTLEAFGNGSCTPKTNSMDLAVQLAPVVTVPPADVTLCETENTTFGISLNAANNLSFQWEQDDGSGSGFLPISDGGIYFGTSSATLSVFNAPDTINGYQYRLIVSNTCGMDISAPATLTVNSGPQIDTQPSNASVCEMDDAIFEVIASGTGLLFQWQENSGGGFFDIADGPQFTGTNTSILTVTSVSLAQSSNQYRVIVSGACVPPLLQQISSPVVMIVDQLPSIVVDPIANPICDGSSLTLQVTAIGTGITFQWEEDSGAGFAPIVNGGVYSGANSTALTLSSVPDTFDGNIYRVIVTGICTPPAISASVPITVHSLPTASFVGNGDACTGADLTFTLTGVGPFDVTYSNGTSNQTLIGISDGHVEPVAPVVNTTYTLVSVLDSNAPRCSGIVDPTPVDIIGLQNITANIVVNPNTPQVVNVNTTFDFDASGSTTAIAVANLTFDWDFGDGNTISGTGTNPVNITHPNGATTTGTFQMPTHEYFPLDGNFSVNLKISYGQCSSSTANGVSIVPVPPTVDFTYNPAEGCSPLTVQFFEQAEFEDPNSYFWNFGDGTFSPVGEANPVHVYTSPGLYTVSLEVTNSIGAIVQEIKNEIIQVNELPVAIFRNRPLEVVEIPDQLLETSNLSIGADRYTWDFGDGHVISGLAGTVIDTLYDDETGASTTNTIDNPVHKYTETGFYDITLIAANEFGCADTLITQIEVIEADDIRVPNVFTPSSGGPNDSEGNVIENNMGGENSNNIFIPVFRDVVEFHMQIFDRWGNMLFESFSEDRGWDGYYKGQIAQQDVYVYKVVVRLKNGEVVTSVGDVTLVR